MVVFQCPRTGCEYKTDDLDPAQAIVFLQIHAAEHQTPVAAPTPPPAAEKVRRPTIEPGISLERWTYFVSRWTRYKRLSGRTGDTVTAHLLECCDEELLLDLHRNNGDTLDTMSEDNLIAEVKRLAVHGESQIISRVNLRKMCQDHQENIRHYSARVKGQAALCNYTVKCHSCEAPVSYADEEINDQLCTGLADPEIQKDVLAQRDQFNSTEELVSFIEDREAGKRSQTALTAPTVAVSKISAYKKSTNRFPHQTPQKTVRAEGQTPEICSYCGESGHGKRAIRALRKTQCPAYSKTCEKCHLPGHISKMCRGKVDKKVGAIENSDPDFIGSIEVANIDGTKHIKLSHKEYSDITGWATKQNNGHPTVTVGIEVAE